MIRLCIDCKWIVVGGFTVDPRVGSPDTTKTLYLCGHETVARSLVTGETIDVPCTHARLSVCGIEGKLYTRKEPPQQ